MLSISLQCNKVPIINYNHIICGIQTSKCIVTICLPGTMTNPNVLASEFSDKYSEHKPRITFASRSVHKNIPVNIRPSVIFILKRRLSQLLSFCLPGVSVKLAVYNQN